MENSFIIERYIIYSRMFWKFHSSKDLIFSYTRRAAVSLNIMRETFYNKTVFIKKL